VDPAALGAFFSGVGAVLSGIVSLRLVQKRDRKECDKRVADLHDAWREGIEIGRGDQ
jgi:hypothetical protein